MKKERITTSKIPGETEQQYFAWILYCELESIPKMMRVWEQVREGFGEISGFLRDKIIGLGKLPTERQVENWSSKYQWVKRKDLKLAEDLEGLREKTRRITQEKIYVIANVFWQKLEVLRKQIQAGEGATVHEVRELWEMLQVELGKPTSRLALKEEEQKPLTDEEKEEKEKLDKLLKIVYEQQGKIISPLLDIKQQGKRRKQRAD